MRIAIVNHIRLDRHLCRTTQIEIIRNLSKLGHQIEFVIPSVKNKGIELPANIHYVPVIDTPVLSILTFSLLVPFYMPLCVLKKSDFVLMDTFSLYGAAPMMILSKLRLIKTKFILDIRSVPVDTEGFYGYLFELQYKIALIIARYLCDGITVLTPKLKDKLIRKLKIKSDKIGVWGSGVSTSLFNNKNYKIISKKLKKELKLEDKFIVMHHGFFSPNKGIKETVEAISSLKDDYPDIVLFILGSERWQDLYKLVKEKKLQKNVIIHKPVDYEEVPKYISICDVGLSVLSDSSGWEDQRPLKLLEYLSMEKPVVVTDIPSNREIIKDEECGIFIPSNNPEEIAKAILYTYNNKSQLHELGSRGRAIVTSGYSWAYITKDLEWYLNSRLKT